MYDPLHDATLNNEQPYPDSYWASTVNSPMTTHRLTTDITTDVAIIGGGYTGLSCALHLAKEHQVNTVVLEANQIAWGCSGRIARRRRAWETRERQFRGPPPSRV